MVYSDPSVNNPERECFGRKPSDHNHNGRKSTRLDGSDYEAEVTAKAISRVFAPCLSSAVYVSLLFSLSKAYGASVFNTLDSIRT